MKCPSCGNALPAAGAPCPSCSHGGDDARSDVLPTGTSIAGKYQIQRQLGAGGMGRVYHALQVALGTPVCIKTLHSGATADPQFAARFEREARATSMLRHPNIVSVFDFGSHVDGSMYLVMEYVDGVTLGAVLKKNKVMSAQRAAALLGQVCDALSFAHARGVIHRDLKPSNIMLIELPGQPEYVKVLDFGSALMLEGAQEGERLTRAGMLIGTPAYMPPEYILGRGVDVRVDVYQVGVLLYLLLTGTLPFRGTAQQVFAQQVSVTPELPSRRNPNADISIAMERVIMRALVKDPAHRYATAADLKRAMENALAGVTDEGVIELDLIRSPGLGIEVAHEERPVVLVSVTGPRGLSPNVLERIEDLARAHGAVLRTSAEEETARLVFGLDRDIPEAASDAMRCALAIAGQETPLRVGIRDGQASCKGTAHTPGFEYELFGDGTIIADRLSRHAPTGHALICGPVARHVPPDLRMQPVPPPPELYEPTFALTDPLQTEAVGGRLPFSGRADAQRALLELAASAEKGRILVLRAPFGLGKTRLVEEIVAQAARLGVLFCVVPASSIREVGPAHPVSLLAALGWSSTRDGSASTTERYAVEVMLGRSDRLTDTFTGERRQNRLVSAALEGISRRRTHGPVVLVLDQLELADDLTWALASRLVDMATVLEVSVVLCVRPETELPFSLPPDTSRLELGPLSVKEVIACCRSQDPDIDRDTGKLVVQVSRGVPLLVEESLGALRRGARELLERLADVDPVDSASRLIETRVDALRPETRDLLECAAVMGPEPRYDEVLALAGGEQGVGDALAELRHEVLLRRSPAGRLQFPSPIIRSILLRMMTDERRRLLHARTVELLQSYGESPARLGELGEHVYRAGDWERAFHCLREAADICHRDGATRQADRYLRLALRACEELGEGHVLKGAQVARQLGKLLIDAGRFAEAEQVFHDAFAPARSVGDRELATDLLRLHGRALMLQGDADGGKKELEAALLFADKHRFSLVAGQACGDLAEVAEARGEPDEAAQVLRSGLDLIEGREDREAASLRIFLYNRLGRLELQKANISAAIALFAQALSIAERIQDRFQAAGLLGNLGGAYAKEGEIERALHFTERALRESEGLGDQIGVARQSFNLALLRLSIGHKDAARRLLQNGYDASRRAGWREGLAMSTAALAKVGATPN